MPRNGLTVAGKTALSLLLLWHMAAVGIYTIPRVAEDRFSVWTRAQLLPIVSPYLLRTMQWQLWDLFSPDPLRAISTYRIDVFTADGWIAVETLGPGSFPPLRHSPWFKLLIRSVDEGWYSSAAIPQRLLEHFCRELRLHAQTPVRLVRLRSVLPLPVTVSGNIDWGTPSSAEETIFHSANCPAV